MGDELKEQIVVDTTQIDAAIEKAETLENQVKGAEKRQTQTVREETNARTQIIRDGLAQQLRQVRENSQKEIAVQKEKLKNQEISEKEYSARYVDIIKRTADQVRQIKATKTSLLPETPTAPAGVSAAAFALGSGIGAAGIGLLVSGMSNLAEKSAQAKSQLEAVESVVRFKLGQQAVPEASAALEKLTASGLLNKSDAAAAVKNLVSMGYTIDQASTIIQRNTDIAIKNRQANYSVSESVRIVTEGYKNGNSVLSDATGISENLEPMLRKHGFAMADLGDKTKGQAARQALLNEITAQTAPFVGDAERAANSYSGAMARMSSETDALKNLMGESISQGFSPFIAGLAGVAKGAREWLASLSETSRMLLAFLPLVVSLGAALTVGIVSAGGFAAALTAVKVAMISIATSPVFLVIAGIVALTGAVIGIIEATKRTPGQALLEEKRQLDELSKSVAFTAEQKKRLQEINEQLTKSYGPLLESLQAENANYETKIRLIGRLDDAKQKLGKFIDTASDIDYANKVKSLEIELSNLETKFRNKDFPIFGGDNYLKAQIEQKKAELALLQQGAMKAPEEKKSNKTAIVPRGEFVSDLTSLQVLQDQQKFNQERLNQDEAYYLSTKLLEERRRLDFETNLVQRKFAIMRAGEEELLSLDDLERRRNALEAASAKAKNDSDKAKIAAALKTNQQQIDAVKRRIAVEQMMEKEHQQFRQKVAGEMYEFGQALLSQEEGAFMKFLAAKLRAFTAAKAQELYLQGLGNLANPLTVGLGLAQIAAGAAIQAAGELGAQAIEAAAATKQKNTDLGAGPQIEKPDTSSITTAAANTGATVINTTNNNTTINEYGTYLREAEFIRKVIRPELAKQAAEQGKVVFK